MIPRAVTLALSRKGCPCTSEAYPLTSRIRAEIHPVKQDESHRHSLCTGPVVRGQIRELFVYDIITKETNRGPQACPDQKVSIKDQKCEKNRTEINNSRYRILFTKKIHEEASIYKHKCLEWNQVEVISPMLSFGMKGADSVPLHDYDCDVLRKQDSTQGRVERGSRRARTIRDETTRRRRS